ncbi:MAG: redoxin family protein [Chloroflexota bacterium]|nr:redoxin family protein [Chloroflexota bacterium]
MRRLRWLAVPAVVVPLAFVLLAGIGRDPRALPSPLIGRSAPEFALTAIDGRRIALAELRGTPVLVNFWASWCVPACVQEHAVLLAAAERHSSDLQIVGVLYDDRVEDARTFLARHGDGGWPNLVDRDGALAIEFGVTGPPESYLIDGEGIVRWKQFGPVTAELLDEQLARLDGATGAAR